MSGPSLAVAPEDEHVSKIKPEHYGAKNGGGYWGTREEAKRRSALLRSAAIRVTSRIRLPRRIAPRRSAQELNRSIGPPPVSGTRKAPLLPLLRHHAFDPPAGNLTAFAVRRFWFFNRWLGGWAGALSSGASRTRARSSPSSFRLDEESRSASGRGQRLSRLQFGRRLRVADDDRDPGLVEHLLREKCLRDVLQG